MESKNLFHTAENGYNCAEVENYIERLKAEYKKVVEYAKSVEEKDEKIKAVARSIQAENKSLKAASAAAPAAVAAPASDNSENFEKIIALIDELAKEGVALKAKLGK